MGYRYGTSNDKGDYKFVNMLLTYKELLHNIAIRESIWKLNAKSDN